MFDYYERCNPPANVGRPLCDEEWHQRAIREDQQSAGLLPPEYAGPILHGARACADRAYRDWKAVVDDLWADEYEALLIQQATCARQEEAARSQRPLDKHAARARQQEAAHQETLCAAQHLLHEHAAHERQVEAARRQCLLDEETAHCRCATQARQTATARVIFLWLCRRRIFARLARQTSRRLQREAALACMQHEQECCARALQAEEHRRQSAAVRAKANQRKAPALCQRLRLLLSESVAERERQRKPAARHEGAARAAESDALALVEDCRAAMWAKLSAVSSLADEQSRPEIASSNLFNAARACIQATCELLAAPLDAILANIEREDIKEGARAAQRNQAAARTIFLWLRRRLLLVRINHRTLRRQQRDAALARLRYKQDCCRHAAVAQERRRHEEAAERAAASAQPVRQRARSCRRTGRRNCPTAPSPPDKAPPSHPHQMQGGLHTPASTTLARATSLCSSVVSSTTPSSMTPPPPSLLPFTFLGDVVRSSSGGGVTYPF